MIRKLLAGTSVLAIAVVAVMLLSIGGSTKSAEATAHNWAGASTVPSGAIEFELELNADDNGFDIFVNASQGGGTGLTCAEDDSFIFTCGFEDVEFFPITAAIIDCDTTDCDDLQFIFAYSGGFSGGSVQFTACQNDTQPFGDHSDFPNLSCDNAAIKVVQVVGAVDEIEVFAQRNYSPDGSIDQCSGIPLYVIPSIEYTDGAWLVNPDFWAFGDAIMCAELRDDAGHPVEGEVVAWSSTAQNAPGSPGCIDDTTTNSEDNGITHNRFWHCDDGNSGEIAVVTACVASVCGSTTVEFGGDPAECMINDQEAVLDVGDVGEFVVTFEDELGNKVPDGLLVDLNIVHTGASGENADVINFVEDTVLSKVEGQITAAISGTSTVSATLNGQGFDDVSCGEEREFSGESHGHPDECIVDGVEDEDFVLSGTIPPGGNYEWGTFVFCGGSYDALLEASGCDAEEAVFYYNKPNGDFVAWVPGAPDAVNEDIFAIFPPEHGGIDPNTIFTAACSANEAA